MPFARLKPHDPRKGHRLRQLVDSADEGRRYVEGHLYDVSDATADRLEQFMQDATMVDPAVVVQGQARAFDVFPSREAAERVLEEEARGQLLPGQASATRVYVPPGRDAPETPTLADTTINAVTRDGVPRTFRGPASTTASVVDAGASTTRLPTAQDRRDAKIAAVAARKKGTG